MQSTLFHWIYTQHTCTYVHLCMFTHTVRVHTYTCTNTSMREESLEAVSAGKIQQSRSSCTVERNRLHLWHWQHYLQPEPSATFSNAIKHTHPYAHVLTLSHNHTHTHTLTWRYTITPYTEAHLYTKKAHAINQSRHPTHTITPTHSNAIKSTHFNTVTPTPTPTPTHIQTQMTHAHMPHKADTPNFTYPHTPMESHLYTHSLHSQSIRRVIEQTFHTLHSTLYCPFSGKLSKRKSQGPTSNTCSPTPRSAITG